MGSENSTSIEREDLKLRQRRAKRLDIMALADDLLDLFVKHKVGRQTAMVTLAVVRELVYHSLDDDS
jgi:hypothetical protein